MSEADTCRTYIVPRLRAAGWEDDYIAEQRRIVSYLNSLQARVDELRSLHAETLKELNALMPSILDKAFKGEL